MDEGAGVSYADRRGTELTRYDPHYHIDGDGALWCRVITDDGTVYERRVSRETALRVIADLALFVARGER